MLGAEETLLNCRHQGPSRPIESGSLNLGPGTPHFRTPSGTSQAQQSLRHPKHYVSTKSLSQRGLITPGGGLVTKSCLTLATPWTVTCQAPLSMGSSRQEYLSGLPFPPPGNLPDPGIEPRSPALQADYLPTELPEKPLITLNSGQFYQCTKLTFELKANCF